MSRDSDAREPVDPPRRDERALVEGLLARDGAALSEFLERTHHPVYCMAIRLSGDPETRRDWAHDVLLGILADLERGRFEYRGPGSFWGWFRKRAHFRLLDAYRRDRLVTDRESPRGGAEELSENTGRDGTSAAWPIGGAVEDPLEELHRVEIRAALERCLEALPNEDHRRSLELLLFRDLPYEEVARTLEVPLNTVRAWIRRGRLAVRRCLVESLDLLRQSQLSRPDDPSSGRRRPEA
jgi:RNA polymerase sigma-70 factor (ECF subfamily)